MHHEFKESAGLTKMVVGHELWLGQTRQGRSKKFKGISRDLVI
jgi:hypothetical protein